MRKYLLAIISLLVVIFVSMPIFAAVQNESTKGIISVSCTKEKEVSPNIVELVFAVETLSKTSNEASEQNKQLTSKVISSIRQQLDSKNNDQIKTLNFSLQPNYVYPKDKQRLISGYTAVNRVLIKTKQIEKAGKFIDLAIANGANRLESVSYTVDNYDAIRDELYPAAVKDLQNQASVLAKSLNVNVVGIKSINANSSQNQPYRRNFAASALSKMDSESSTPMEPGKINISVSLSAEFEVK